MAYIALDHVSMTFHVRRQFQITLKEYLLKGMFLQRRNPRTTIHALQDINVRIEDGQRIGILGANGSGKSTLLRLLAGVYTPSTGRRLVRGKISSLFELALGFEMEANGWDNILRRGFLMGEKPRALRAKVQEIAEFSELGTFLDIPVRYYSAGMLVRLAFSIATSIEPEILLVDEVLCAGDLAFQAKARERMREMIDRARIIVLVSHDLERMPSLCDEGIWLDRGRIRKIGPIDEVIAAYQDHVNQPAIAV